MKINADRIEIECSTNEDIPGAWSRTDAEQEMKELGVPNVSWIQWTLGHAIDDGVPAQIVAALESGYVAEIRFVTDGGDFVKAKLA